MIWVESKGTLDSLETWVGGVPNLKGEKGENPSGKRGDDDLSENKD